MRDVDRLRQSVTALRHAYEAARADLLDSLPEHVTPEQVQTTEGRYILLDALTTLVHAEAVLADAQRSKPSVQEST